VQCDDVVKSTTKAIAVALCITGFNCVLGDASMSRAFWWDAEVVSSECVEDRRYCLGRKERKLVQVWALGMGLAAFKIYDFLKNLR